MSAFYYDTPTKERFVSLMQAGQKLSQAASECGIHQHTARAIWKKYQIRGTVEHAKKPGRPSKMTPDLEREILRACIGDVSKRSTPLTTIAASLSTSVSITSIRRVLASHNAKRRVASKKPSARLGPSKRLAQLSSVRSDSKSDEAGGE